MMVYLLNKNDETRFTHECSVYRNKEDAIEMMKKIPERYLKEDASLRITYQSDSMIHVGWYDEDEDTVDNKLILWVTEKPLL